ncbi:MAG: S-layer homology domain-containing protein [Caldisericia bacterium]|nr:S-layer homology domain-containing protein [Caldisericia bacterium]
MKKILILIILIFISFEINIVKGENIFVVKNTNPYGENSFLWAIEEANKEGGIIKFDIPKEDKNFNGKSWTIFLRSNLPTIERKIIIDGLSQNEKYTDLEKNTPLIDIDASLITSDSLFTFKYDFELSGLNFKNFKSKDYIRIETNRGTIKNISIDNGDTGIHLFKSSNIKILNSTFKNLNYGIYLYYSNYNIIDEVNIENSTFGIRFYFSSSNEIKNSIFKNSQTGIRIFYNSLRNKIYKNTILNNEDGIFLRDSFGEKNDLFENKFVSNLNGIHLYYGTASLIYKNEFYSNEIGLNIDFFSSDNSIFNNTFKENNYGVKFFNSCEKNIIKENIFEKNKKGIFFEDKSNRFNSFSKNIFIDNNENINLSGGNEGITPIEVSFAKTFGKSVLISTKSDKKGKIEIFSSDILGNNSISFLGEKNINNFEEIFYILTNEELLGKYILYTFTDDLFNTSEFGKVLIDKKAPFLDLILKKTTQSEKGGKVEFLSEIKNYGDEDIEGVIFKIQIPREFGEINILSNPKGSKYKIENNQIIVENIKVAKNSNEFIKFSFSIGDKVTINTKFSLHGEIEYFLYGKLKIIEKSDENGIDDGVPQSFNLDEPTEFTITGKPQILVDIPQNLNINSNSIFSLKFSIKNIGNYLDKNVNIKISIPDSFDYLSSNIGQFKREERTFYLNFDSIKENEIYTINLEFKSKETISDKKEKISFLYKSETTEIKKEIDILIKGEGKESLSLRVEGEKETNLYSFYNIQVFIKNSGTKEAKDKILKIAVPNNFNVSNEFEIKSGFIEIKIDKIGINEEKKISLIFKSISSCDSINTFEFNIDNLIYKKDVFIKCFKIFHNQIITGFPDSTFKPDIPIKRVEVAAILSNTFMLSRSNLETLPKDVKESHWGKNYILNVISSGLMSGYKDGTFKPDEPLKRSEAAAIIFKILSLEEDFGNYFKDIPSSYWAKGIIGGVYKSGIISGYKDKTFKGEKSVTRAEFLVMLLKAIGREGNLGEINKFKDLDKNHWAYKYILESTIPHILINPQRIKEIKLGQRVLPIFIEKDTSFLQILKIGDKLKVSIPFLYEDLKEIEVEILENGFKLNP